MLLLPIFLLFCNLSMCSISLFHRFCSRLKSKLYFLIEGFRTLSEDNTKTCDIYLVCWPLSAECIIYSPWCLINSILFSDNFNYGEHNFFFTWIQSCSVHVSFDVLIYFTNDTWLFEGPRYIPVHVSWHHFFWYLVILH